MEIGRSSNCENFFIITDGTYSFRDKWVPVTTAWRVLMFRMDEQPAICREALNMLNKQSRTDDKGWPSSLDFERDADNS